MEAPEHAQTVPLSTMPDRLWPRAIVLGLLFVVAVNIVFIYIAVSGADEVVPSYMTEGR